MPTTPLPTYTNLKQEAALRPDLLVEMPVKIAASQSLARGTVMGEQVGQDAIYKITPSQGANQVSGGTWTFTWGGHTSAAISALLTAPEIQALLEAVTGIGVGNIVVRGGPLTAGEIDVEFTGALGLAAQVAPTVSAASLTAVSGGTAALTVASLVTGAAGTPGTFTAYNKANTDGSQVPVGILVYDVQTDSSGNVTFSDTSSQAGGDLSQKYPTAPIYISGFFNTADLTGLDYNAIHSAGFHLKQGTLSNGLLRIT